MYVTKAYFFLVSFWKKDKKKEREKKPVLISAN